MHRVLALACAAFLLSSVAASATDASPDAVLAATVHDVETDGGIAAVADHVSDLELALRSAGSGAGEPYPRIAYYLASFYASRYREADATRVVAAGAAAAPADDPIVADLLLLGADALRSQGRWPEAMTLYWSMLKTPLDPAQAAEVHRGLAIGLQGPDSATQWRAVLALEPDDPEAAFRLAEVQAAALLPPQSPQALRPRAVGRTHDCNAYIKPLYRDLYDTASARIAFDVDAQGIIGNVRLETPSGIDAFDAAVVSCVREAWKFEPALQGGVAVAAPNQRAVVTFMKNQPVSPADFLARGQTMDAHGRHIHAVLFYDRALALDPDFADAYRARARAYEAAGDHARAAADSARLAALYSKK